MNVKEVPISRSMVIRLRNTGNAALMEAADSGVIRIPPYWDYRQIKATNNTVWGVQEEGSSDVGLWRDDIGEILNEYRIPQKDWGRIADTIQHGQINTLAVKGKDEISAVFESYRVSPDYSNMRSITDLQPGAESFKDLLERINIRVTATGRLLDGYLVVKVHPLEPLYSDKELKTPVTELYIAVLEHQTRDCVEMPPDIHGSISTAGFAAYDSLEAEMPLYTAIGSKAVETTKLGIYTIFPARSVTQWNIRGMGDSRLFKYFWIDPESREIYGSNNLEAKREPRFSQVLYTAASGDLHLPCFNCGEWHDTTHGCLCPDCCDMITPWPEKWNYRDLALSMLAQD